MKKFFEKIGLLLTCSIFVCLTFTGCDFGTFKTNIFDGYDTDEYVIDYVFDISASKTQLTFDLDNLGYEGDDLTIVALQPYQYMGYEDVVGLAEDIYAEPHVIATCSGGKRQQVVVDRYIAYYNTGSIGEVSPLTDGIILKYYCLNQANEVLAGPKYVTEIEAEYSYKDPVIAKSIKGVYPEDSYREEVFDLGASHVYVNFRIDEMLVPNETYKDGVITKLDYEEGVDKFGNETITRNGVTQKVEHVDYNGKRYYIRLEGANALYRITHFDELFKSYTDKGVRVTVVILLYPSWSDTNKTSWNQEVQPYLMNYPALEKDKNITFAQVNTGNEYGAGYWGALMEFLARRYSYVDENGNAPHGLVQNYIIGNEIDYSTSWNNIVPKGYAPLSMPDYMEEYERELRIANQILKKYYPSNKVLVPITHNWTNSGEEYSPKNIVDYLTRKTLEQGNYDYGFATHPYCSALTIADFWKYDTLTTGPSAGMSGALTSSKITFSNLELWQLYLEQKGKLCNGKIRSIFLTEGGVSGSMNLEQQQLQAAGIAYAYYKASQLDCVEAFIYYRLQDNPGETSAGLYSGLLTTDGTQKPSYEVYKYLDTSFSFEYSNEYLNKITWSLGGASHGIGIDCETWQDVMELFPSRFDWNACWDTGRIMVRDFDN